MPLQKRDSRDRPVVFDYTKATDFIVDMFLWRRACDPHFSVRSTFKNAYKCSPALVTQILQSKRKLQPNKVEAFSLALGLNTQESAFLTSLCKRELNIVEHSPPAILSNPISHSAPKNHLLHSWLNVYVKDAVRVLQGAVSVENLSRILGNIVPYSRIERSLQFLLANGFLRRALDGRIVEDETVVVTTDEIPNEKIVAFHRQALKIAERALQLFPTHRRRASAIVLPLNEKSFAELKLILKDFHERLLQFAEERKTDSEALYQVTIHLSPIGGKAK